RGDKFEQITEDHSLLNDYIKMKRLTPEEIENFPHKNVIVRALGMKENVKVDTTLDKPQNGDIYVLCSDGLAGPASDEEIHEITANTPDLKAACSALIAKANANGGPDNITVVMAKVIGVG
ncbi:MAG: serine/threonine-protein phosphatase, partial [Myxococcales bacterium]|nr:serine/threonine-protein phosphatase [Myxococcales bacterium]